MMLWRRVEFFLSELSFFVSFDDCSTQLLDVTRLLPPFWRLILRNKYQFWKDLFYYFFGQQQLTRVKLKGNIKFFVYNFITRDDIAVFLCSSRVFDDPSDVMACNHLLSGVLCSTLASLKFSFSPSSVEVPCYFR